MTYVEKVQCESCGVTILATTAESYDGYCAPCYKKFNEAPPTRYEPPKETWFHAILGFLIPIGIIALFLFGTPLGFYLVLGGRTSTIRAGTIQSINLVHEIPNQKLDGLPARIVQGFVIVEFKSGESLWIPDENIAGIVFTDH